MAKRAAKAKKAAGRPAKAKAAPRRTAVSRRAAPTQPAGAPDVADTMATAAAALTRAVSAHDLDAMPQDALRQLIAAVVRAYSAKVQAGEQFLPFEFNSNRVSPTDVMLTCSGLLKAADLQVFELGMWQSFTGR
jgi:hypothetical protein